MKYWCIAAGESWWNGHNHFPCSPQYLILKSSCLFSGCSIISSPYLKGATLKHLALLQKAHLMKKGWKQNCCSERLNSLLIWHASGPSSSLHKDVQSIAINQFKPSADKSLRSDSEKLLLKDKQRKVNESSERMQTQQQKEGNNHQNWRVRLSRRRKRMRV